jgi:hypothetical protein
VVKEYNVRLNQEEIDVLASVLCMVGGDPEKSPRRVTEAIRAAVEPHARKGRQDEPIYVETVQCPMWFRPYPNEATPMVEELPHG